MPGKNPDSGLETIRYRRRLWLEWVGGGVLLAFWVNLFAGSLMEDLRAKGLAELWNSGWSSFHILTGVSGLILLAATLAALWYLRRKQEVETDYFSLHLPLAVDPADGAVEILNKSKGTPKYVPAIFARQVFSQTGTEFHRQFAASWPGPNPFKFDGFQPGALCWDTLHMLAQAVIFKLWREFGHNTLTAQVRYHSQYLPLAGKIDGYQLPKDSWPPELQKNIFLNTTDPNKAPLQLRLPIGAGLAVQHPPRHPQEPPGRLNLSIQTGYGSLTFSLSPYWTLLRNPAKALQVFPTKHPEQVCFLVIPLELRLLLGGFLLMDRDMQYHYFWFRKLMEDARNCLSWGEYLKRL
jgi:hypothetical protein